MAELELAAQSLHHAYSSAHGIYHAIHDVKKTSDWSQTVPLGTEWHHAGDKNLSDAGATGNRMTETKEFKGDLVLARSIAFMRDALLSREAAYAAADGDVGRLYETLKVDQNIISQVNVCLTSRTSSGHDVHIRRVIPFEIHYLFVGDHYHT